MNPYYQIDEEAQKQKKKPWLIWLLRLAVAVMAGAVMLVCVERFVIHETDGRTDGAAGTDELYSVHTYELSAVEGLYDRVYAGLSALEMQELWTEGVPYVTVGLFDAETDGEIELVVGQWICEGERYAYRLSFYDLDGVAKGEVVLASSPAGLYLASERGGYPCTAVLDMCSSWMDEQTGMRGFSEEMVHLGAALSLVPQYGYVYEGGAFSYTVSGREADAAVMQEADAAYRQVYRTVMHTMMETVEWLPEEDCAEIARALTSTEQVLVMPKGAGPS